jgi:hypothetical protein
VDSIDPWIVSGIPVATDEDTEIEEGIVVSDTVRVTAVILPDGTFLALTIELIDEDAFPIGCFTIATTVLGLSGDVVTITGWPAITLDDDIEIEGNLATNTIIIIAAARVLVTTRSADLRAGTLQLFQITGWKRGLDYLPRESGARAGVWEVSFAAGAKDFLEG